DRDHRLATYIPLARNAYYALKRAEEEVILPNSMANLGPDPRRYQVRIRAIAAMRDGPHRDFLGRKTEIGQAFSRTMKPQQCCYFCKGMMGYKVPSVFKQEDIEDYICHIEWHWRGNYAHSCAGVEVS